MFQFIKKIFGTSQERTVRRLKKTVVEVNRIEQDYISLTDDQLRAKTGEFASATRRERA